MSNQPATALGGLRVLDLAGLPGQYATRLMADLGADVIKIEPPGGDPVRALSPFAGGIRGLERSLTFLHYNTNKRSVIIDITTPEGRKAFLKLVRTADVVVESFQPGYLDDLGLGYEALAAANPGVILTSISPFGQTGPYSGYKGLDLHAEAMGGWMTIQGDPEEPPCMAPGNQGYVFASVHAAVGTMHAILARETIGRGQHVDVSMQEVIATSFFVVVRYSYTGEIEVRKGAWSQGGISAIYPAKDGFVCLAPIQPHQWRALLDWTGNPLFEDPIWTDRTTRVENSSFLDETLSEFTKGFTVAEFVEQAQAKRIPAGPVLTTEQFLQNPNFKARDYMVEIEHPVIGRYQAAGAPFKLSETPWRIIRPAPLLGEHTEEVMREAEARVQRTFSSKDGAHGPAPLPLAGTRVADFTRVWVGPYAVRQFADFGADVIKIESSLFDTNNRTGLVPMTPDLNRNRYGITLDLHKKEAQETVRRLAATSDIVVDNYAPAAMERFGLGYKTLREANPGIIQLSMPGWGLSGPYRDRVSYGNQLIANSGITYLWGHDAKNIPAHAKFAYPDFLVGITVSFVLLAALYHKRRTGQGQFIEVAQTETLAHAMGVELLEVTVNGHDPTPRGNVAPDIAPHNVYPCKGEDTWCAIACSTDDEFRALAEAIGKQEWLTDERLATMEGRLEARAELDAAIGEWTRAETPKQAMHVLQKAGVPAVAVQTNEDIFHDPHLRTRNFIIHQDHPDWGPLDHAGLPVILSETPGAIRLHSPALGEHNDYVLHELLGLSDDETRALEESGALI